MLKFITSNKTKFREAKELLKPIKIQRLDIILDEIQDIDPHKIIKHKLKEAFKHHKGPFIIEDDSTTMAALGGKLPGPFIKWFNDYLGVAGITRLAEKMGDTRSEASAIVAYAESPKKVLFFSGKVKGKLVAPRGSYLFGYDPIFVPVGFKKTLSQLKAEGDFTKSPRALAVKKLKKFLVRNKQ